MAANVAHSFLPPVDAPQGWAPEIGAVVGAVVWPVFLFVAVEILARTAWPHGWSWGLLRWAGLLPVAGVAAFVSYRHLSGLLTHYGEDPIVAFVGPLAVDGLMIMATGALIAGGRSARSIVAAPVVLATAPPPAKTVTPPATPVTTPPSSPVQVAPIVASPQPAATPPAPPAVAPQPAPRVQPVKRPAPVAAMRPASAKDTSVAASDPGPRKPSPQSALLARARHVAKAHRASTGNDITAGELAVRLRVGSDRAQQVLAELGTSNDPQQGQAPVLNGTPVASVTG